MPRESRGVGWGVSPRQFAFGRSRIIELKMQGETDRGRGCRQTALLVGNGQRVGAEIGVPAAWCSATVTTTGRDRERDADGVALLRPIDFGIDFAKRCR